MGNLLRRSFVRLVPSVGVRSVLLGAHQFLIHPAALFVAWWRLYGVPRDPRLLVCFALHDLGYAARRTGTMDGPDGELHPLWAARQVTRWFDGPPCLSTHEVVWEGEHPFLCGPWGLFVLTHSRFLAKAQGRPYSRLCVADKLALAITPRWLYLPLVRLTGELEEYMHRADERRAAGEKTLHDQPMAGSTPEEWWERVTAHCWAWALEHADGRTDTWTPEMGQRVAKDASGVWR